MSSGLPLTADVTQGSRHVSKVPTTYSCATATTGLFDHLVGSGKQGGWNDEAERPSRLEIDGPLEFGRLFDRQIGRFHALQDTIDVIGGSCQIPPTRMLSARGLPPTPGPIHTHGPSFPRGV